MSGPRKWVVTTFNDSWLADERFKRWLEKVPGDSPKALCILYNNKKMDIANMGVSALVSHKSFKKHSDKERVHLLSSMFFTKTAAAVASKPASLSTSNPCDESDQIEVSVPVAAQQNSFQTTFTATTPQLTARDAVIRWSIKTVLSHFLYWSNVSMKPLVGWLYLVKLQVAKIMRCATLSWTCFEEHGLSCTKKPNFSSHTEKPVTCDTYLEANP